jgi:hypothetical protein
VIEMPRPLAAVLWGCLYLAIALFWRHEVRTLGWIAPIASLFVAMWLVQLLDHVYRRFFKKEFGV